MTTSASVVELERNPDGSVGRALSAAQCRAARGLLNWSQSKLCEASKVGIRTLGDFEREMHTPGDHLLRDIRSALETAGIAFLSGEEGAGVRLVAANRYGESSFAELKPSTIQRDNSTQRLSAL